MPTKQQELFDKGRRLTADMIVSVRDDDGTMYRSRTTSNPWALGDGTPVIGIEGIAGGYSLERIEVLSEDQAAGLPHFKDRVAVRAARAGAR